MQPSSTLKQHSHFIHHQKSDRPQLLDLNKTQQFRQKHATLQNTIQSTIQGLMEVYRNKNVKIGSEENKNIRNQVFDRLALIFSQMNEFKGQIDNTISYLNQGVNVSSPVRQMTPIKRRKIVQEKMRQISNDCQYQKMQQQNIKGRDKQQKKQEISNYQQSLEERYMREKDNKMESQK